MNNNGRWDGGAPWPVGTLPGRISEQLAVLRGLPLWKCSRAGAILNLAFGNRNTQVSARTGKQSEVGDYSLAVDCSWRIRGPEGILVGSADNLYTAGSTPDVIDFSAPEPSENRLTKRLTDFQKKYCPTTVLDIDADAVGGFRLLFGEGVSVDVFICDSAPDEQWRLFSPTHEKLPHHVVFKGSHVEIG